MPIVAPSLLAADFTRLGEEIEMINRSEADWLHVDVMDGVFVPNISFGEPVMKPLKKICKKPFDVHLMIVDPDRYLQYFKDLGADVLTVHYEACTHLHRTIGAIKELGMKAAVSLNPHTSINSLENVLPELDMVLIMSVNPGFGGQKFIEHTYAKVGKLREMANELNPDLIIEVDGGVNLENAPKLVAAGANALVAGSSVFKAENPEAVIAGLKNS
ncbi:MAG: ribulose-phosphate 3-epimerase [Flavobacteriales bacterium]|nr:ribulose-phosphate 3-epimerase [Flavobacteriales bacterium]